MKSIKPGRGPSAMSAISSIAAAVFGVFWIITAVSMGAPLIFPVFGIIFIVMSIAQAVYNYKNATSKNRFSSFDITDSGEESDPFNERFMEKTNDEVVENKAQALNTVSNFCPYCGAEVQDGFEFCRSCGKKLPD